MRTRESSRTPPSPVVNDPVPREASRISMLEPFFIGIWDPVELSFLRRVLLCRAHRPGMYARWECNDRATVTRQTSKKKHVKQLRISTRRLQCSGRKAPCGMCYPDSGVKIGAARSPLRCCLTPSGLAMQRLVELIFFAVTVQKLQHGLAHCLDPRCSG